MATDKFDYARLLNDIDAKIAALQGVRASVQAAAAAGALGEGVEASSFSSTASAANGDMGQPIDLPEGAFNGKSLPTCVELYLSAAKRKKTIKEIAAALREGGVESISDNFENVVTGALFRLKKAGKVLRFKDGWGLPQWYPANIRAAAPSAPTKRAKKKAKKRSSATGASITVKAAVAEPTTSTEKITTQSRIVELLKRKREISAEDVVRELPNVKGNVVRLLLGRLTDPRRKIAERTDSGMYRLLEPNGHRMAVA